MLARTGNYTFKIGNVLRNSYDEVFLNEKLIDITRKSILYTTPSCSNIVVIGILGIIGGIYVYIPDNSLLVVRDQMIKDIRFTKTLALYDSKFKGNPINNSIAEIEKSKYWFKSLWQIKFTSNGYDIFSDAYPFDEMPQNTEMAINPTTNNSFHIEFDNQIKLSTNFKNWNNRLFFDNMGRPYYNMNIDDVIYLKSLIKEPVQIKLSNNDDSVCFQIEAITGYVHITDCIF